MIEEISSDLKLLRGKHRFEGGAPAFVVVGVWPDGELFELAGPTDQKIEQHRAQLIAALELLKDRLVKGANETLPTQLHAL